MAHHVDAGGVGVWSVFLGFSQQKFVHESEEWKKL